jgi:hypothetical protein
LLTIHSSFATSISHKVGATNFFFSVAPRHFQDFPIPSLWKFAVRIVVQRPSGLTLLNLKHFYVLFEEIQNWKTLPSNRVQHPQATATSTSTSASSSFITSTTTTPSSNAIDNIATVDSNSLDL